MAEKIEQRTVSVRIDDKEVTNSLRAISKATSELYQEVSKWIIWLICDRAEIKELNKKDL